MESLKFLRRAALLGLCWLGGGGLLCPHPAAFASTADHSRFEALQREFKSGPEVTRACLSCHTEAAREVMRTKHWTWEFVNPDSGQRLGKKNVLNNFCISIPSNYEHCTACHAGYGWKDDSFDFTREENVDCLVCHDTTGRYRKLPGLAGNPPLQDTEWPPGSGQMIHPVDLRNVAQHVGKSSRYSCGACHFNGGGGDGVKHGDMDGSLAVPERELDVHMDVLGADFNCATCHMTQEHQVPGSRYAPTAQDRNGILVRGKEEGRNPATCQSCHGNRPHPARPRLNNHATKLACQTCHIPAMARGGMPTKLRWDWSTSGRLDADGKPFVEKDAQGHVVYDSKKGSFVVGENVVPEYRWFNGKVHYTLLGDAVDKSAGVVHINWFEGSPDDGQSMIWPVKVFRGKQPYDPVNRTLVTPHTVGYDASAYWNSFGWVHAIATGMATSGAPFSGQVDFVDTEMSWPLTHMVAPKELALGCPECHGAPDRLNGVPGIYLPGRRAGGPLDLIGWGLVGLALLSVAIHGILRFLLRRRHAA